MFDEFSLPTTMCGSIGFVVSSPILEICTTYFVTTFSGLQCRLPRMKSVNVSTRDVVMQSSIMSLHSGTEWNAPQASALWFAMKSTLLLLALSSSLSSASIFHQIDEAASHPASRPDGKHPQRSGCKSSHLSGRSTFMVGGQRWMTSSSLVISGHFSSRASAT